MKKKQIYNPHTRARYYWGLVDDGFCVRCKYGYARKGKRTCLKCALEHAEYYKGYFAKNKERITANNRLRRANAKSTGQKVSRANRYDS